MNAFKHYFAVEKKLRASGMRIERAELISEFTGGAKSSLRDLSSTEYSELLTQMNNLAKRQDIADKLNLMRRKVIANLTKCGYITAERKADMERINNWCVTHGHAHKRLNDYNAWELQKLITQAENMYAKFLERL